jgi:hypothetical protein
MASTGTRRPERAVPFIGLFGALDPTDGGNTQRFSRSGQWAKTDGDNAWQANFYAVRSAFNLWSDFTFFLQDPIHGDQFHQHETRTLAGGDASYTLTGSVAGIPTEQEIGVQTRRGLCSTNRALERLVQDHYWNSRRFLRGVRQCGPSGQFRPSRRLRPRPEGQHHLWTF